MALYTPRVRAFVGALTDITVGVTSLAILATATRPAHTAVGVVLAVLLLTRAEWAA
jgi:hypothetical protein